MVLDQDAKIATMRLGATNFNAQPTLLKPILVIRDKTMRIGRKIGLGKHDNEERKKKRFLDDLRDAIAISIFKRTSSSTQSWIFKREVQIKILGKADLEVGSNPNVKSGQSSGHDMRSGQ
ncbi:hypothetical protein FNV43_RR12893 [Rhamnella rubrinervis]|uniref:Uncharacterized protein n=1 Tax=Rhamnella rubrinervis TaxID=2594499 RepID=A0A8K0MEE7_9ROSA|nr:hypothetical protein FNV43_RR12893 [Rhamnella rubrinervis]